MDYYLLEKEGENSKCGMLDLGKCIESDENSTGENVFATSTSGGVPSSFSNNEKPEEGEPKRDSGNTDNHEEKQVIGSSDDQVMRFLTGSREEVCRDEREGSQIEKGADTCESSDSMFRNIIDMRDGVELRGDNNQLFGIGKVGGLTGKTEEKVYSEETVSDVDHTASSTTTTDEESTKSNLSSDVTTDPKKGKSLDEILDHFCDDNSDIVISQGNSYSETSNTEAKELPAEHQERSKSQLIEDKHLDVDKSREGAKVNKMNLEKRSHKDNETQKGEIQEAEEPFPKIYPEEENIETEVVPREDIIEEVDEEGKAMEFGEKLEESKEEAGRENVEETAAKMHTEIYRTQSEEKGHDIEQDRDMEAEEIHPMGGNAKALNKGILPNEFEESAIEKNKTDLADKDEEGSNDYDKEKETNIHETDESEEERSNDYDKEKETNIHETDESEEERSNDYDKEKETNIHETDESEEESWNQNNEEVSNIGAKAPVAAEAVKDTENSLEMKTMHAEYSSWTNKKRNLTDVENSTSTRKKFRTFSDDEENSDDIDDYLEEEDEIMDTNKRSQSKGLESDEMETEEDHEEKQMERIAAEERMGLHTDQEPKEKPVNGFEHAKTEAMNMAETEAMNVAEEEHGKKDESISADTSKEIVSDLQKQEKSEQNEKGVEDSSNVKSSEGSTEREEISKTLADLVKDAISSADEEEVLEKTKIVSSKVAKKKPQTQPNASKVTLPPGKAVSSLTRDGPDHKSDSSIDFDEESIENISRTIRSFSNEKPPSKKTEKRSQNSSKNDDPSCKRVIVVKTAPNVEKVKRKLEEILEKSKGEEDAAIAELQRMKKEKTDILNAITTEMEKLKSMLVKDKQG